MQTPKAKPSLEVPIRKSPATTPRTARQPKTSGSEPDSGPSPNRLTKTPKSSPKVLDRRSPRSPASEKKRPNRVSSELESQLNQLQDDLKKAKEQLNSAESCKRQAQQEAEEAKTRLIAMSTKLEESEQTVLELSNCEDDRIQELRKLSQERDKAWESELEAVKRQHLMDSSALVSALNEVQKLKAQLERVSESEAVQIRHAESAHLEVKNLRIELSETVALVQKLRNELDELEQCKARVRSLEGLVSKLQAELINGIGQNEPYRSEESDEEKRKLKSELGSARSEAAKLRSALDEAEIRYQEEFIRSTLQIRSAYEQAERTRTESSQREIDLESELSESRSRIEELEAKIAKIDRDSTSHYESDRDYSQTELDHTSRIEELHAKLAVKETELRNLSDQNKELISKIESSHELNACLSEKESKIKNTIDQNNALITEISELKASNLNTTKANEEANLARESAREALTKLDFAAEEAEKHQRRAERATEELEAAIAANSDMETELKRVKVQSEQWRKAAEAAAAMLTSSGPTARSTAGIDYGMGSPYSEEMEEDGSPKKRNGNVLKKIGVLWKKGGAHK